MARGSTRPGAGCGRSVLRFRPQRAWLLVELATKGALGKRSRRATLLQLGALALLWLSSAPTSAATASPGASKVVRYRGYRIVVPAAWPVYDLRYHPEVCVRFDRHAVYLGEPSSTQRCPARAVGRTEAILIEPLVARGARARSPVLSVLAPVGDRSAQPPKGPRPSS